MIREPRNHGDYFDKVYLYARSTPPSICPQCPLLFDHQLTCLNKFTGFQFPLFFFSIIKASLLAEQVEKEVDITFGQ